MNTTTAHAAPSLRQRPVLHTYPTLTRNEAQEILQIHPEPVAAIRRPGRSAVHVLMLGNGLLRGVGLRDHEQGLPGRLADEIGRRRNCGVSLDVIVHPDPFAGNALATLTGMRLSRYDAVILIVDGTTAADASDAQLRGAFVGLVEHLIRETTTRTSLSIFDSSDAGQALRLGRRPRATKTIERFGVIGEEVCALSGRVRFGQVPPAVLPFDPARGFADGSYLDWAGWITARVAPALGGTGHSSDSTSPRRFRERTQPEQRRQEAVDALHLQPGDRQPDLDLAVRRIKLMNQVTLAALTVVDRGTLWSWAITGSRNMIVDRAATPCDIGVRSEGLLVIRDLWWDERTREHPALRGPVPLRSYAGYPIHSWDGYRIGMVCLFDEEPGRFRGHEMADLRDLAGHLESQLWRKALRAPAR